MFYYQVEKERMKARLNAMAEKAASPQQAVRAPTSFFANMENKITDREQQRQEIGAAATGGAAGGVGGGRAAGSQGGGSGGRNRGSVNGGSTQRRNVGGEYSSTHGRGP